jgi:hypothetical protein
MSERCCIGESKAFFGPSPARCRNMLNENCRTGTKLLGQGRVGLSYISLCLGRKDKAGRQGQEKRSSNPCCYLKGFQASSFFSVLGNKICRAPVICLGDRQDNFRKEVETHRREGTGSFWKKILDPGCNGLNSGCKKPFLRPRL